jgi:hypothetical protein
MKLEQQVCSLDLAKRLKELGVHQISLFWWQFWLERPEDVALRYKDDRFGHRDVQDISAFTVAELGEMLKEYCGLDHQDMPRWYRSHTEEPHSWVVYVPDIDGDDYEMSALTEADARAKMLIYLIENNLITV